MGVFSRQLTGRIGNSKDEDRGDNSPSTEAICCMYTLSYVQHSHEAHATKQHKTTIDGCWASTPFIDNKDGQDREDEDENGRDA